MNDDALDVLLRKSKPTMAMPPTFQAEVWRRIAVAQESPLWGRLSLWLESLLSLAARPLGALVLSVVMIVGGLWLGMQQSDSDREGMPAYLESVSPFVITHRSGQ